MAFFVSPLTGLPVANTDDDMDAPPRQSALSRWILRHQGWLLAPMVLGMLLSFAGFWRIGTPIIGLSFVLAGLVPVISGVYASPLYRLRGWPARIRGLVTVGLGVFVGALPWLL